MSTENEEVLAEEQINILNFNLSESLSGDPDPNMIEVENTVGTYRQSKSLPNEMEYVHNTSDGDVTLRIVGIDLDNLSHLVLDVGNLARAENSLEEPVTGYFLNAVSKMQSQTRLIEVFGSEISKESVLEIAEGLSRALNVDLRGEGVDYIRLGDESVLGTSSLLANFDEMEAPAEFVDAAKLDPIIDEDSVFEMDEDLSAAIDETSARSDVASEQIPFHEDPQSLSSHSEANEGGEMARYSGLNLAAGLTALKNGIARSFTSSPDKHIKSFAAELKTIDARIGAAANHASSLEDSVLGQMAGKSGNALSSEMLKQVYSIPEVRSAKDGLMTQATLFEDSISNLIKIGSKAGLDKGSIQETIDAKLKDFSENVVSKVGDLQDADGSFLKKSLQRLMDRINALIVVFIEKLRGQTSLAPAN